MTVVFYNTFGTSDMLSSSKQLNCHLVDQLCDFGPNTTDQLCKREQL